MTITTRRAFLRSAAAAALAPAVAPALANIQDKGERRLQFYNLHTGERLKATYWAEGAYQADELKAVNHLLRDHRTEEVHAIDRELLDLLYGLQNKVDRHGELHVISGYRSPKTNARLRSRSGGVAKRSLHMRGKAIDIRLPEVDLSSLHRAALDLHRGGVGYYPDSGFIHVDTGRPRSW